MSGFAVVDLETTGLSVGYHHRIVEIGVVQLSPTFEFQGQWSTLVDPQRDIGESSAIHGLTSSIVAGAPRFDEIAGDLLTLLAGRYLVAHNARFDTGFLMAEFARAGLELAAMPAVCTLGLSSRAGIPTRLQDACVYCGITHEHPHAAISDAMVTAQLFIELTRRLDLTAMAVPVFEVAHSFARSGRTFARDQAMLPRRNEAFVASLATRLAFLPEAAADAEEGAVLAYADLLGRALEDRVLDATEMDELASTAADWGLTLKHVGEIHRTYLTSLAAIALADEILTDVEQSDLERVCDLLGLERRVLSNLIAAARPAVRALAAHHRVTAADEESESLLGKSVCFTGACVCTIKKTPITRAEAELLAASAGLSICGNVTRKLDVLVVADPETQSGKAKKAREQGTRIIAERVFWSMIGIAVD